MTKKFINCRERRCDWRGLEVEVLKAPNPFEPEDDLLACPICKSMDGLRVECEVDGCINDATCGINTKNLGYIRCCGKHMIEFGIPREKA